MHFYTSHLQFTSCLVFHRLYFVSVQWCAKFHSRRVKHTLFGIDFNLDFSPVRNAVETFAQNNDTQIKQVGI